LKINTHQAGRIAILDLDGPLRLGPAEDVFRSQAAHTGGFNTSSGESRASQ
jgi:hypothetical protein